MAQANFQLSSPSVSPEKAFVFTFLWSLLGSSRGLCWLVDWLWAPALTLFLLYRGLALFRILMQTTALCQSSTFQGSAFSHNYMLTFVLSTFKGSSCYKLPQAEKKAKSKNNSSILEGAPNKIQVCPLTFSSCITQIRRYKQWLANRIAYREKVSMNNAREEQCVDK